MVRKFLIVLFILLSFSPLSKINAQTTTSNAGFASANNIWYSEDPFQEGDNVGIYTLVFNPDDKELSGTVVFFDKDVVLGTKDFKVTANGVEGIHINWIATVGSHTIFGRIQNAKFLTSDKTYIDAYLAQNETTKSSRTVLTKIVPVSPSPITTDSNSNANGTNSGIIQNVAGAIKSEIPTSIIQPVSSASNALEKFRTSSGSSLTKTKDKIKDEIKALDNNKNPSNSNSKNASQDKIFKPFKYVELFFLSLFSFIFKSQILFYGILLLLTFFILRFIWRKIFKK